MGQETLVETLVGVHATIPQERPVLAGDADFIEIQMGADGFRSIRGSLGEDLTERIAGKGGPPEIEVILPAGAVDGEDEDTVGDGVAALHGLPGAALDLVKLARFGSGQADGGGIDEDLGAAESHETRGLRIPLIPADENTQLADRSVDGKEAGVARGKVELFAETGVVRDMHLPVGAEDGSVRTEDHGGVVVQAARSFLKMAGDEGDFEFFGGFGEEAGGWAGDGFGQFKALIVFLLAEVEGAEEFGQADQLGTLFGLLS